MHRIIVLLALALGACSTGPSPQASVYATKSAYAVALTGAVAYNRLTPCGLPASPPLCRDAAVVTQLRKASDATDAAIDSAETVVRDPKSSADLKAAAELAASEALKALNKILALYGK